MLAIMSDIHGDVEFFNRWLKGLPEDTVVIQLGDHGFGWNQDRRRPIRPVYALWGNHDVYPKVRGVTEVTEVFNNVWYVPRGEVMELAGRRIGFLGGADSVDKIYRQEEIDWWADERIHPSDAERLVANVSNTPLDLMITHTPPAKAVEHILDLWNVPLYSEFHGSAKVVQWAWEQVGKPPVISGHMHPDTRISFENSLTLPINDFVIYG